MSRRIAMLAVLVTLLAAGSARAATPGGAIPALLPQLVPPRLLTEVGKPVPPRPVFNASFTVSASHGYKVEVHTFGSAVVAEVTHHDHRTFSLAAYLARGVAMPRRLQATFGNLGRVSMRFRPPKNHRGVESICRFGERLSRQYGTYVGHFSFKGENGYVSLDLHRAKGSIVTPAGRCPRRHLTRAEVEKLIESLFEPASGLLASSREGVATTSVLGLERKSGTRFIAAHEETHGRMAIIRMAFVNGGKGKEVHVNEAVTAASLSPPRPFHGTGHYHAAPDGTTTWTGPLSVNFLGAPRFPLTGPSFEAQVAVPPL
jgi:hypothetical protein